MKCPYCGIEPMECGWRGNVDITILDSQYINGSMPKKAFMSKSVIVNEIDWKSGVLFCKNCLKAVNIKLQCKDCKHFSRVLKGQKGGLKGDCQIVDIGNYGLRSGYKPACKTYFEPKED